MHTSPICRNAVLLHTLQSQFCDHHYQGKLFITYFMHFSYIETALPVKNPPSTPFHVQCVSCYNLSTVVSGVLCFVFTVNPFLLQWPCHCCTMICPSCLQSSRHRWLHYYTTPSASRHCDLSGMDNDCVRPSRNTDITSVLTRPPVYRGRVSHI